MAIIIGDIHCDLPMAQAFLAYKPEAVHVALGDYVDRRGPTRTFEVEQACLDLLTESRAVLLWGNHDLAYAPYHVWENSGNYSQQIKVLELRFQAAKGRFKAAYSIDGWLCTHAGLSTDCAHDLAEAGAPIDSGDTDAIACWINDKFEKALSARVIDKRSDLGPLFNSAGVRGGSDRYGGILRYDPHWEAAPPDPRVRQIFGHTKTEGPQRKGNWINIHIEDGWWVYDTEIDNFVRLGKESQI